MIKLPTFLIVGVQKAGTTSIYNYLQEHPQVFMSRVKETNFLEQDWETFPPEKQNKNRTITIEDYVALFTDVRDEIAIGEASPNYLFHYESSAARIKKYVPNAQLIIVLRNPIERAYSDYLMHIRDAIGSQVTSFSEQIDKKAHKSFIIRKGFYATPVKYYLEQFGTEQIKVYLYDDLVRDSEQFMQDFYTYIGVNPNFKPDVTQKVQQAKVPKNQTIHNLLQRKNLLRTFAANSLKTIMPLETRQKIRDRLIIFNSQSKKAMPLTFEDRQKLINLYREDILQLQDLINRDLSSWLK
jgi:hypothetical protein